MSQQPGPGGAGGLGLDEKQAEQWLATLRSGSPDEKAAARRGLAALFERRGMLSEAIDLLVANAREGYRDVESFQALSRLYRAQGDEYLSASAALEATRLSSRGQRTDPQHGPTQAPWQQEGPAHAQTQPESRDAPPSGPGQGASPQPAAAPFDGRSWRRPLRIAGWLAVVGTALAALAITSTSTVSAVLYLISAAALAVLLSGMLSVRRLLRLPDGPLGDGALLFGWLLLAMMAGAILPRGPGAMADFGSGSTVAPTPGVYFTATPGLYRTPVVTLSPSPTP